MMTQLTPFAYDGQTVRTVTDDQGEPWFVAADVCTVLEIGNVSQALTRLDVDEKGVISNETPGGMQQMATVSEAGLYALILGSRKPQAKPFRRWVTHEVLPSIRRHGMYATAETVDRMLADPDTAIRLLCEIKAERTKRSELEAQAAANAPKVIFADAVSASHTSILVGELAKILRGNGIEIGQNRLYEWLRNKGYLIKRKGTDYNMPAQRSMELDLFEIKETAISHSDGHVTISKTPKVTGKGQTYFVNKFLTQCDATHEGGAA